MGNTKENMGIFKNKDNSKSLLKREILFRGKRVDNGEWVYGNYEEAIYSTSNERQYQIGTKEGDFEYYGVIAETVGQYTGLTDKNGKMIFEGDILKSDYPDGESCYYEIVWAEAGFHADCDESIYIDSYYVSGDEVVGNVHDNPELL